MEKDVHLISIVKACIGIKRELQDQMLASLSFKDEMRMQRMQYSENS